MFLAAFDLGIFENISGILDLLMLLSLVKVYLIIFPIGILDEKTESPVIGENIDETLNDSPSSMNLPVSSEIGRIAVRQSPMWFVRPPHREFGDHTREVNSVQFVNPGQVKRTQETSFENETSTIPPDVSRITHAETRLPISSKIPPEVTEPASLQLTKPPQKPSGNATFRKHRSDCDFKTAGGSSQQTSYVGCICRLESLFECDSDDFPSSDPSTCEVNSILSPETADITCGNAPLITHPESLVCVLQNDRVVEQVEILPDQPTAFQLTPTITLAMCKEKMKTRITVSSTPPVYKVPEICPKGASNRFKTVNFAYPPWISPPRKPVFRFPRFPIRNPPAHQQICFPFTHHHYHHPPTLKTITSHVASSDDPFYMARVTRPFFCVR